MKSFTCTFLYILCTVDPTILVVLNEIGYDQALPTTDTIKKTKIMMDCAAAQPDTGIRFHTSIMCLHIDSEAAHLVHPKARSRAAGHYYLSNCNQQGKGGHYAHTRAHRHARTLPNPDALGPDIE